MTLFKNFFLFFQSVIKELCVDVDYENIIFDFDYNDQVSRINFGDISTNIALLLSKKIKKNPLEIAALFKEKLMLCAEVEKVLLAGPGFINIYFKDTIYKEYYKNLLSNLSCLYEKIKSNKKYNIEFVSANPTGPLHFGHGRGAVIGDVCAKIFKLKEYQFSCEYYINDAGTQIEKLGKSVYYQYAILCNVVDAEFPNGGYQGEYITELAEKLYALHGDSLLKNSIMWFSEYAKDILLNIIKNTLLEYQVNFQTWFSEKNLHTSQAIERAVKQLQEKDYVYVTDDNAVWFRATLFGDEKDRVLKKTDGAWTYIAADIAYFLNKIERGYTTIIMVLGQDHHSFKIRIEAIAKAFGFDLNNLHIILYQLVSLKDDGKIVRMSKRKGNSIELQSIIDTVGSDVARFFYLQRKADAHLDFDVSEALEKSNKNPVFYIQYALVRINSILKKAQLLIDVQDSIESINIINMTCEERMIMRKIAMFDLILEKICKTLQPHLLTYYTLELSALFHSYYAGSVIISDDKNISRYRVGIIKIMKQVLEKSVMVLGISIPEQM